MRVRIPFLVDVVRGEMPELIQQLADDRQLDREMAPIGPLINRIIVWRIRRALTFDGKRLPAVAPRDDEERAAGQLQLEAALDPSGSPPPWDEASVGALADYVRGGRGRRVGELVQEAIGRLFSPDYRATRKTWRAAVTLNAAVRSNNPLRHLFWSLTGTLRRAQRSLSDAARGDPAAIHATGIAVHNLVASMEGLAGLYRDQRAHHRIGSKAAVARVLVAPPSLVRQCETVASTLVGDLSPGTIVTLDVGAASRRGLDPRVTFMRDSWSFCPAHRLVPALIGRVWEQSITPSTADGPEVPVP